VTLNPTCKSQGTEFLCKGIHFVHAFCKMWIFQELGSINFLHKWHSVGKKHMLLGMPLKCPKYPHSCTCILVEVSTVLTEDGWKDILAVLCCVVVREAVSVLAHCIITLDAPWFHSSSHAPCWTHATSRLGALARPVFVVVCVQSADVARNKGCSTYRPGWSWLPKLASIWKGQVENLYVTFSSHHMKTDGCNCWEWLAVLSTLFT
jgi:hypothetical protein